MATGPEDAVGPLAKALSGLTNVALAAVVGLASLQVAVSSVAALNPATAQLFGQELKNLQATIGVGLMPVVQQATATIREWAGILLPIMQRLAPLLAEMGRAVGSLVGAGLRAFGALLGIAMSVLEPFVSQIALIVEAIAQGVEVLGAFLSVLQSFIGFDADLSGLRNVVADLVRIMALFAAKVLAVIAGLDAVKKFRDAIQKAIADRAKPPAGAIAAPKDSSVGGIEDIARRFAERAFVAAGAGRPQARPDADILEDILKDLNSVVEGTATLDGMIYLAIIKAWNTIKAAAAETAKQTVNVGRDVAAGGAAAALASGVPGSALIGGQLLGGAMLANWVGRQFD